MFGQLFGDALLAPNERPQTDSTAFLTEFAEKGSVLAVYHKLQDEFANRAGPNVQSLEAEHVKKAGNINFSMGRYSDAAEAYKRALELSPGDARMYTNIALSLIRCGRYEEAVTYAHGATVVDPLWPKGFALMGMAYAHLGYTDVAQYYATFSMQQFGMEMTAECERAIGNSIVGKLNPSMYRTTTPQDLQSTLNRFSDYYINADQLIFLFIHLDFHMSCKDQNQMTMIGAKLRSTGFLRRLFRDVPITSGVISRSNDLLALSPEEAHLLSACLRITGFASCGSPQACNDLLSCQEFLQFLSSACRQIVSGNFIRSVLADQNRYVFHREIVENLLRTVATTTSQGAPFNRFLRPIDPFKNFSWHVKLLAVWFSLFPPVKNADLMCHLIVSVSKVCEEFPPYLDELTRLPKQEALGIFSLLATISQIYVECCIHPSVGNPIQLDLLLVFWLFLTKDPRAVSICVQCPQVWTFFSNRLKFVSHNINASSLSGETWFILEVLCNMTSYLNANPSAENCLEGGKWLDTIAESCADVAWRKSKHHVSIRSTLMLAARLGAISAKFSENFAQRVTFTRLVRLASCGEPDVDAPALHCIGSLLTKINSPGAVREITSSTHFSEYIAKMVTSITHGVNPLAALVDDSKTGIYCLLDERNGEDLVKTVRNALWNELKKSPHNCEGFVKKLKDSPKFTAGGMSSMQPKRKGRDEGIFSEPLPEDVSADAATAASTKLFDVLAKGNDELASNFNK